jgi:hypothetical protein
MDGARLVKLMYNSGIEMKEDFVQQLSLAFVGHCASLHCVFLRYSRSLVAVFSSDQPPGIP